MNCAKHQEKTAALGCSGCGKGLCEECLSEREVQTYCGACAMVGPGERKSGVPTWVWVMIALGGLIIVACPVVFIVAAIAIPNLIEARKTGNETAAIGALRTIASVQAQFREGDREGDSTLDYATSLAELSGVGLIDNVLGSGTKAGYLFSLSGSTYDWQAWATPISSNTGARNFTVCTDGVVRFTSRGLADCMSAPLQ